MERCGILILKEVTMKNPNATYEYSGELREHTPWIKRMRWIIAQRKKEREEWLANPVDPRDMDLFIEDSKESM